MQRVRRGPDDWRARSGLRKAPHQQRQPRDRGQRIRSLPAHRTQRRDLSHAPGVGVLIWHNGPARTGQYLVETTLTTANVNTATFGRTAMWPVDGLVDAQPLYASAVTLADGSAHNLVIAATEHARVYASDPSSGAALWHKSMLAAGETTSDSRGCNQVTPEIGATATPAIDRSLGSAGTVFVTAASRD